jgi:hypothetical protein
MEQLCKGFQMLSRFYQSIKQYIDVSDVAGIDRTTERFL